MENIAIVFFDVMCNKCLQQMIYIYIFDEQTLILAKKVILLRSDFIGIPSRLTRPALIP